MSASLRMLDAKVSHWMHDNIGLLEATVTNRRSIIKVLDMEVSFKDSDDVFSVLSEFQT